VTTPTLGLAVLLLVLIALVAVAIVLLIEIVIRLSLLTVDADKVADVVKRELSRTDEAVGLEVVDLAARGRGGEL
jgi:hypothetical protein